MRHRSGTALSYVIMTVPVIIGFCSLVADYGRVRLAKSELQSAADAAAMYGLTGLATNVTTAQDRAIAAAQSNTADGSSIVVDRNNDIDFLSWNAATRTYTVLSGAARSTANAMRVTCRRSAANGNAVPLLFGGAIGMNSCNVHASAIASTASGSGVGFVGLNSVTINGGPITVDSYLSASGAYSGASARSNGSMRTNGAMTLNGTITVKGDARRQTGNPTLSGSISVSGTTTASGAALSYAAANAGSYSTTNDNANIPGSYMSGGGLLMNGSPTLSLAAGNYYLSSVTLNGTPTLNVTGAVTLWVNGNVTLNGAINVLNNLPSNFKIRVIGNRTVTINGSSALAADVYAPTSNVTINGTNGFYGSAIGKTLTFNGTGGCHFDESLGAAPSTSLSKLVQ